MRRRRLIVLLLVVLVVVAGGVVGQRLLRNHRLAQQRADYAAGLDASHRADCARALPRLSAAREGGSAKVRAAATQERHLCQNLQQIQARTADQVPTAALLSWIGYLDSAPPEPFQAVAVTAARTAVKSGPLSKIMTAPLCRQRLELAEYGILTVKSSDPLAADFIAACLSAQAESDPLAAVRLYSLLRSTYPKAAARPAVVTGLGRMVSSRPKPEKIRMVGDARSLGGKTQLVIQNGRPGALEMVLAGKVTRMVTVKPCKTCKNVSSVAAGLDECARPGSKSVTVTLPAGSYSSALVDLESMQNLWVERWNLQPNHRYIYCWWSGTR